MRTKLKFIGLTFVAICLLLIAVGFFFRKKIASHYIPEVEQVGVIHVQLKNDTSYIQLQLAVKNLSFLRIQFDTLTYEISLFNKTYLQKQHFLGIVLPGHGYDTLHASIKIPYVAILRDLAQERGKRDSTNYAVQLFLQYSTWFGKSEIDIHRSAKLKIPAVPEFEITDIKWTKVRLKSIQAAVSLKLTNHSDLALAIHDFRYVMEFLEQGNITGVHQQTILIKPKAETFVTIPVDITPTQLVETAFSVMTNHDQYGYNLKVNATLEPIDSVGNRFQIELVKNGIMELKKQSVKARVSSR